MKTVAELIDEWTDRRQQALQRMTRATGMREIAEASTAVDQCQLVLEVLRQIRPEGRHG